MTKLEILRNIYYDIENPASFSSVEKLLNEAVKHDNSITRNDVIDFLSGELAYTLHRRVVRQYQRNPIIATQPNEMAQADLIDMQRLASHNNDYRYILTLVDVFSKKGFAIPIKKKDGPSVRDGLRQIFTSYKPHKLQTDEGLEFKNKAVQNLLKEYRVHFFVAKNEHIKCSIVERFHRTLLSKIYKYFTATGTLKYYDKLQLFIKTYNNTYHRSIRMTPNDVNDDNIHDVFRNLYNANTLRELLKRQYQQKLLSIGDNVRIPEPKGTFKKGYVQNFSDQIYTVCKPIKGIKRPVYKLKDYEGKPIKGNFYPEEIQRVKQDNKFRVRILQERNRGRGKQYLIEWVGYPNSKPEWIAGSKLESLS